MARWYKPYLVAALVSLALLFALVAPLAQRSPTAFAQAGCRAFPETGRTVCGRFLQYWDQHGGLTQQGLPISNELGEVSPADGKTYTEQYFERAVFEYHPEQQPPSDVLLSLLGNFLYQQKYPSGAPGQVVNGSPGSMLFSQTGHRVGGGFLDYWKAHGGLVQQGYPISEEFDEVSNLNGKTYKVQYFQRVVFEYHPENQPPYDVLLSQLGTLRYRSKYLQPSPTPVQPTPPPTPIVTPTPTNTPIPITSCEGIPDNLGVNIWPRCAPLFSQFTIQSFEVGEWQGDSSVGLWATMPNGKEFGAPFHVPVRSDGTTVDVRLTVDEETPYFGVWVVTMEGLTTHRQRFGYFKVTPYPPTGSNGP